MMNLLFPNQVFAFHAIFQDIIAKCGRISWLTIAKKDIFQLQRNFGAVSTADDVCNNFFVIA
ncbi:hypothetical protein CKO42_20420 [Lamprobacter modestohalophilus]|uniref:Uncharacterized protein n=1 Tax=Lamprobacter modestohalophilus TaxID=1064514 RepID=A0A9X0WC90_9GAMM|nr:hypothetical protein [Lamprobacter modestohalophilus]